MAYNITLTNGQNLVTVADGTIDTNYTSLTLVGKNFAGYGAFLNENYVKMLENFANTTEPPNALQGQIWWDTTNKLLKVKNGNSWKSVSSSTASGSVPENPTVGDMWWDTGNSQLKVWSGSAWIVIGPAYTAAQGKTGLEASVVTETGNGVSHIIVKFWVNNVVTAVLSRDPSFVTNNIPNFSTINPGFNLATGGATPLAYYGDANNALNLGGYPASTYLRSNQPTPTFDYPVAVTNDAGLTVGANSDFTIGITPTAVKLMSNVDGKNMILYNKIGGVYQDLLTLDGTSGSLLTNADPTLPMGVATKNYVDAALSVTGPSLMRNGTNAITGNIAPQTNGTYSFGSAIAGFDKVYATTFQGTATNSLALGGIAAANFVRNDITVPITTPLNLQTDGGITVGGSGDFTIDVTSSPNAVNLKSNTSGKSMIFKVKIGGNPTTVMTFDGINGLGSVIAPDAGSPTNTIATKGYVDAKVLAGGGAVDLTNVTTNVIPTANNTLNIGSPSKIWNTVYATTFNGNALTANYADLAERFESDQSYIPGTVVELGGSAEITSVTTDLSENVFGVISTKAAYLMNAAAGTDETHPPIAMQGRVPVRVIGTVNKGDRLVSAGNGLARAALKSEITPFNVIGRALQNKLTHGEGTVEAIVKLNS